MRSDIRSEPPSLEGEGATLHRDTQELLRETERGLAPTDTTREHTRTRAQARKRHETQRHESTRSRTHENTRPPRHRDRETRQHRDEVESEVVRVGYGA